RLGGEERKAVFEAAARVAVAAGVTNVHAIEGDAYRQLLGDPAEENRPLADLLALDLPLSITPFDNQIRSLADLDRVEARGVRHVGGDIFVDGVLGAAYMPGVARAALSAPYADGMGGTGHLLLSRETLAQLVQGAAARGQQVSVHAVGDRAIATVLDVLEQVASAGVDVPALRFRIEHGTLPADPDIDRAARLGVIFSMQPVFELRAGGPGRSFERRLGPERVTRTHPLRRLVSAGVCIAGGSDSPANPVAPIQGIRAALQHTRPDSRLTTCEVVAMFTRNAAFAAFQEGDRGAIREGGVADFVVLSDDPLRVAADAIEGIRVVETWHRGARVF
ncbi:MAG TPA: amidohydrolase family protein, partial [bacterium]|nr:amidohydrolase family protein [bacterium]